MKIIGLLIAIISMICLIELLRTKDSFYGFLAIYNQISAIFLLGGSK